MSHQQHTYSRNTKKVPAAKVPAFNASTQHRADWSFAMDCFEHATYTGDAPLSGIQHCICTRPDDEGVR